ncbi:MAG: amino acid ABC transporter permease [Pseudooceanicola atlanticus]
MRDLLIALLGKPEGIILFQLLEATQFTIYLSLIAFLGGGLVGGLITLMRIAPSKTSKRLAVSYIWLFQSTPLLMMLFLTGLGLPRLLGVDVNPWTAAVISLVIYASAYLSDVWRGAVESVPTGQWEGARSVGLGFLPTLRLVILPQAFRIALAPTVGFMVQIIKGTSLAYIIGFHDLMAIGKRWANAPVDGSEPFIIFPIMALIYFALCYPLTLWSRHLERRLGSINKREKVAVAAA